MGRLRPVLTCALLVGCGEDEAPTSAPPDPPSDLACPPGEWLREEDNRCMLAGVPPDGCGQGFVHDGDRGCDRSFRPSLAPTVSLRCPAIGAAAKWRRA